MFKLKKRTIKAISKKLVSDSADIRQRQLAHAAGHVLEQEVCNVVQESLATKRDLITTSTIRNKVLEKFNLDIK